MNELHGLLLTDVVDSTPTPSSAPSVSMADINKHQQDRYRLLAGGDRVLQGRQQTLRALVDWSCDLQNESAQRAFRRLGVFAGGFDLAAA